MKLNIVFSTLLSVSFILLSCKKEEEATVSSDDAPKEIIVPSVQPLPDQTYVEQTPQNAVPTQNQMPAPTQNLAGANKAGMNPAHGQPGHRCDIAVGASLNSPQAKKPATPGNAAITTQTISTPATTTTTQTPQAANTPDILNANPTPVAAGMNPAHGQPGHQCGIAVGAPLPK